MDQEWCLECGSARTLIHGSPNWRAPVAIVGAVVALALVALAITLINLSSRTSRSAPTQSAAVKSASAAPAQPKPKPKPKEAPVASWPTGLNGWTVQLAQRRFKDKAFATARRISGPGVRAGVLNSSDHPSMTRGYWIVFAGRYPDHESARQAALRLRTKGYPSAHSVRVAPPGGI